MLANLLNTEDVTSHSELKMKANITKHIESNNIMF